MFEQAFKNIDDILHETRGGSLRYQGGYGLSDTLDIRAVLVQCGIASAGQGDRRAGGGT